MRTTRIELEGSAGSLAKIGGTYKGDHARFTKIERGKFTITK